MEVNNKQPYESPEVEIVEVKTEGCILAGSKPDYDPEEW
jgi:hypothetical protein